MDHSLPLIGREQALRRFEERLLSGGGVLLIEGEIGTGKSHLLTAFMAIARKAGRPVSTGRCLDAEVISGGVVALDDLQWADPGTLELLRQIVPVAASYGALVVATYRLEDRRKRGPLCRLLPVLLRHGAERISLPRLNEAEVEQMLRAVGQPARAATVYHSSGGIPLFVLAAAAREVERAEQALQDLLRDVPAETISLLRTAAVIGGEFTYELLQGVANRCEDELLAGLEEAVEMGLLREAGPRFAFVYPPLQAFLYKGLLGPKRLQLHRRIAALVSDPDEMAHHTGEAGAGEAAPLLLGAARRAMRAGAYPRAVSFARRGFEAAGEDQSLRAETALMAAYASRLSDPVLAVSLARAAKDAASRVDDRVVEALAGYLLALDEAERAPHLMDRLHGTMAALWRQPRLEELQETITGRPAHHPGMVDGLAQVYLDTGRPGPAAALLLNGLRDAGPYPGELDYWLLAEISLIQADLDSAFRWYHLSVDDALARRNYQTACYRVAIWLDQAVLWRPSDDKAIASIAQRAADVHQLARANGGMPGVGTQGPLLALWHHAGERDRVRLEAESLLNQAPGPWARYYADWAVRLALTEGRITRASSLLEKVVPAAGPGADPTYRAYRPTMQAMTQTALCALRTGDIAMASAWLETVDAWTAGPRPSRLNEMVNLLGWAEFYRITGHADRRRDATQAAHDIAHSAGITSHGKPGETPPADVLSELTPREADVAKLVAKGMTDRAIAAELTISRRTVDGHLRNIFGKLQLTSRAGLAVWVLKKTLGPH